MMFGKNKENGIWRASALKCKFMFSNHDALYISLFNIRLRIMKPNFMLRYS